MATLFGQAQLKQIVTDTLIDVPVDHTLAIVGSVDTNGMQIVGNFTAKNGRWKFQGAYRHEWTGDDIIGAKVIYSQ